MSHTEQSQSEAGPPTEAGPDEKYCADCGSVISEKAEICPDCGVRQAEPEPGSESDSGLGADTWAVIGLICLAVGFFALAVIAAPIAIFAGYQVYRKDSWFVGAAIGFIGTLELLFWGFTVLMTQPAGF